MLHIAVNLRLQPLRRFADGRNGLDIRRLAGEGLVLAIDPELQFACLRGVECDDVAVGDPDLKTHLLSCIIYL